MSIDYGEKERQFLATLKADTGRDLDEWMAAIAAEGLSHRNDVIDWLRRQGFMFSKASWIERIHNNGGRPIYAGAGTQRPRAVARRTPPRGLQTPAAAQPAPATPAPSPPTLAPAPPTPSTAPAGPDPAAFDDLLARAKAYRPLAQYVLAEIRKAVPGVAARPHESYIAFDANGRAFAVLAIGPRELRLGLALRNPPASTALEPARFSPPLRGAPAMTHMAVLTDARQITPALIGAVSEAAKDP
ncbi:MAG TPA: DUF5655 domain-containing protein [Hyphomicrobium sp.]|nr:DUF5655 domain-containing protein [Hyphomicrobium sp.]HRO49930.1 DUF5655 domain-containing protein [Hyphomicrobium sp.]